MGNENENKEIGEKMHELRVNLEGYKSVLSCLNGDSIEVNAAREAVARNIRLTMDKMEKLTHQLVDEA